jgi:hypothetical protein
LPELYEDAQPENIKFRNMAVCQDMEEFNYIYFMAKTLHFRPISMS